MTHNQNMTVEILMDAKRWGVDVGAIFGPRFDVNINDHSTGTHVNIRALMDDESPLPVWDYHQWKSSQYEFNNEGKRLGLQEPGPWAELIDIALDSVSAAIEAAKRKKVEREEEDERERKNAHARKVRKFAQSFGSPV